MTRKVKILVSIVVLLVVVAAAIQWVPVERSNPAVRAEIQAPPAVLAVLKRSCYDCHSNETRWPWYAHVAPVSWMIARDVHEGREHVNFSEWSNVAEATRSHLRRQIWREVEEGNMPLDHYVVLHPEAHLSQGDREVLQQWSQAAETPASETGAHTHAGHDHTTHSSED